MLSKYIKTFTNGLKKLKNNPQLSLSIFVALTIVISFTYLTNRFVGIAKDAQDNLVNIRMGSMMESFVEFAPDSLSDKNELSKIQNIITDLVDRNPTILNFQIVNFTEQGPVIVASNNQGLVGEIDAVNSSLYEISKFNTKNAFTHERMLDGQRVFVTTKIIEGDKKQPIGSVLALQHLTEADKKINDEITKSIYILVLIVFLIMFLFFKHARIIDYTSLYKKLKEIDNLKDDFISMVSHELRSPLTVISGYAEELDESDEIPQEMKKNVSRIQISARQLDDLVGDMLDVSKIDQGRLNMKLEKINPLQILGDIVTDFTPLAEKKGLKFTFHHNLDNKLIEVDQNRFRQTLVNLFSNAIKYTPTGTIKVQAKIIENSVEIRVIDSGVGISAEDQKKLFRKFERINPNEVPEVRGTGLGLWITKQIVEQMGGKINVESIRGVGTHFIITFKIV